MDIDEMKDVDNNDINGTIKVVDYLGHPKLIRANDDYLLSSSFNNRNHPSSLSSFRPAIKV